MISKAFDTIKKYDVIVIHRHQNPDGDAMGSQLGLKRVLQQNFPDKKIYA
ncbi:MAG TPA: bifunctional oligoribonuclease/PAP phosphatase, partial [Clostridiales bacterium]|nr:bifunctional oligoribonuclease/PAP phosphatase [Clostridiales bacterium]